MRLSENRILAWIVLVVCVIGSVVGLGGNSLARERREAIEVFYNGAEDRDSTHSMSAYLSRAFENARIMALEVQLHLGEEQAQDMFNAFEAEDDGDFLDSGSSFKRIRQLADDLYNKMYAAELSDQQRRDFKIAYDDFQGAVRLIEKDPYLDMAAEFNKAWHDSFISEGVGRLLGIDLLSEGF